MSHNLIVNTAKAALTAIGWLLKLVVAIISACVSMLFVAFQHSSDEQVADNLGNTELARVLDIELREGRG